MDLTDFIMGYGLEKLEEPSKNSVGSFFKNYYKKVFISSTKTMDFIIRQITPNGCGNGKKINFKY